VLPDHAVAFDDNFLAAIIADDPLAATNGNHFIRLVMDGDEINEGIRSLLRRFKGRHIHHLVNRYAHLWKLAKHHHELVYNDPIQMKSGFHAHSGGDDDRWFR
jgi:hypothetical protein